MNDHEPSAQADPRDPLLLEQRRQLLQDRLRTLRADLTDLTAAYRDLPYSGLLLDTPGTGALTTPAYCVAGATEVFDEALIELDAANDALGRAAAYTGRLRRPVLDA
ncbi:hypothetical protein [Nocardia aurantiaca]|uniref:ESX-1 secretion-associated protein n=1 Tax=Nocardia aurantiaca TaxID=2675850 RepID=A0A6I3KWW9_9NOCA|nr:hypothetical protein [Nocardia aurantiaca]MTE12574.1 hypothetical protein [Nocardia aurantiaca]